MERPFVFLGASHIAAIALTFAAPLALAAAARSRSSLGPAIRHALAAPLAINWSAWMLMLCLKGWLTLGNALPLNLCDWATAATFIVLLRPGQRSFELAYFWALGGTLQALITPDCVYDFPDAQFVLFFVYHGTIITAVLFLVLGQGLRPIPVSLLRAPAWTLVYLAVAGTADALLGTNYGFLRAKPLQETMLDFLSPWPYYVPELVIVGLAFMLICYARFLIADCIAGRDRARTN